MIRVVDIHVLYCPYISIWFCCSCKLLFTCADFNDEQCDDRKPVEHVMNSGSSEGTSKLIAITYLKMLNIVFTVLYLSGNEGVIELMQVIKIIYTDAPRPM